MTGFEIENSILPHDAKIDKEKLKNTAITYATTMQNGLNTIADPMGFQALSNLAIELARTYFLQQFQSHQP